MIQRSLLRQSRTAAQWRPSPTLSAARQSFHPISPRLPAPARARIASRWFSSQKALSVEAGKHAESTAQGTSPDKATTRDEQTEEAGKGSEDAIRKELDAKNKDLVDMKDKYLRQVAEYRNLQERTRREIQAAKDFAIQRFARDLIESVDTFDLALSNVPAAKLAADAADADANTDLRQLHSGLRMTETVLMNTLKKHGLERFDPSVNGDKFDPNVHEATFMTPQAGKEDGTVFHTTQKGFVLNGRVVRAAKVGVVKNA